MAEDVINQLAAITPPGTDDLAALLASPDELSGGPETLQSKRVVSPPPHINIPASFGGGNPRVSTLDGGLPPVQSIDTDDRPIITTIGGVPVGISVANILGVDNAFAAFAIDVVTDPILWLSLAFPPLAGALAGAKIAKGVSTLGAAGAAAAKGLNVGARAGKGLSGLTRLGRAARSAKGLSVEAKLKNIDRSLELLEKAASNPQLARQAKTALQNRNLEAFRAAVAGIETTKPAVGGLLPILRSSGFRGDLKALFQLEAKAVKVQLKKGLSRIDAMDVASRRGIEQLAGTTAERTLANQQAAMIFRNPFTGREKVLIRAPGFVGAMEGLGSIGATAFPAALAAKIGVDAQRVSVGVSNFHDIAVTAREATHNTARQLFPEVAEKGIGNIPAGAAKANPFADVYRTVIEKGKEVKNWTLGVDYGDAYHNYVSAAQHEGRVAVGAMEKAFAVGGGRSRTAVASLKRFLGFGDLAGEALLKQQAEAVPIILQAGGTKGLTTKASVKAVEAASQLTKEQLQIVDILRDSYDNLHAGAVASGNEIGFVENYTHSIVRLTEKGVKEKKSLDNIVDSLTDTLFGSAEKRGQWGKQSIQKPKKFLHTELLDLERQGLVEVLSKDPFEAYRHYVNSAAKMHGQTQIKRSLLAKEMIDEASGMPLLFDIGKEASKTISRTVFSIAAKLNNKALNKSIRQGADTVDVFDEIEKLTVQLPRKIAAGVKRQLDSARPRIIKKLEKDTGQKYITTMSTWAGLKGVVVHPSIAKEMRILFEPSGMPLANGPAALAWDKMLSGMYSINAIGKKSMLGPTAFHFNALAFNLYMAHGPGKIIKTFSAEIGRGATAGAVIGGAGGLIFGDDPSAAIGGALVGAGVLGAAAGAFGAARAGRRLIEEQASTITKGYANGLVSGNLDKALDTWVTDMVAGLEKSVSSSIVRSPITGFRRLNRVYDRALWDFWAEGLKVWSFNETYSKLYKESLEGIARGTLKKSARQAEKEALTTAATWANHVYGGNNFRKLMMTPQYQRMLSSAILAPDWTFANVATARDAFMNFTPVKRALVGSALGGAGSLFTEEVSFLQGSIAGAAAGLATIPLQALETGLISRRGREFIAASRGKGVTARMQALSAAVNDSIVKNSPLANEARQYAIRSGVALFTAAQMANFAFTGHFTWDNEEGHEKQIELPITDPKGRKQYIKIGKQFAEPFEWAFEPLSSINRKAAFLPRTAITMISGRNYFGQKIVAAKDGPIVAAAKKAGYALAQFTPIAVRDVPNVFTGDAAVASTLLQIGGAQVRRGRPTKEGIDQLRREGAAETDQATGPSGGAGSRTLPLSGAFASPLGPSFGPGG